MNVSGKSVAQIRQQFDLESVERPNDPNAVVNLNKSVLKRSLTSTFGPKDPDANEVSKAMAFKRTNSMVGLKKERGNLQVDNDKMLSEEEVKEEVKSFKNLNKADVGKPDVGKADVKKEAEGIVLPKPGQKLTMSRADLMKNLDGWLKAGYRVKITVRNEGSYLMAGDSAKVRDGTYKTKFTSLEGVTSDKEYTLPLNSTFSVQLMESKSSAAVPQAELPKQEKNVPNEIDEPLIEIKLEKLDKSEDKTGVEDKKLDEQKKAEEQKKLDERAQTYGNHMDSLCTSLENGKQKLLDDFKEALDQHNVAKQEQEKKIGQLKARLDEAVRTEVNDASKLIHGLFADEEAKGKDEPFSSGKDIAERMKSIQQTAKEYVDGEIQELEKPFERYKNDLRVSLENEQSKLIDEFKQKLVMVGVKEEKQAELIKQMKENLETLVNEKMGSESLKNAEEEFANVDVNEDKGEDYSEWRITSQLSDVRAKAEGFAEWLLNDL